MTCKMWLSNIQRGRKNAQKKNKQTTARKTKKGKKKRNEQMKDGKFFMYRFLFYFMFEGTLTTCCFLIEEPD